MNTHTNMNSMALGCIVAGLIGAAFTFGAGTSPNVMAPQQVTKAADMCAVAASFAATDAARARQMSSAIGCSSSRNRL